MARSQVRHNVHDEAGNSIQNALVYVYETGTTTAITDLYAASSGGAAISGATLTSDAQGDVIGWVDTPRTLDFKVTDNTKAAYYPSSSSRKLSWDDFTETVPVGMSVEYANATYASAGGASVTSDVLKAWTSGEAYELTAITRDSNEAITTATVKWPDGSAGTFTTTTASVTFPGAIDAYTISHTTSGKTVTQALMTRDSGGAVTTKPTLTVA